MHSKTNRQNHDFQIAYFLAGSCHTPDAAYALLSDLKDDRADAIKMFESSKLRQKAKILRAQSQIENASNDWDKLEAEADLVEIKALEETTTKNYNAALDELATIQNCIELIQPLRKYAHLPDAEAHEAAQEEEWELELIRRAENYLLTAGTIPADHFSTMRMHPKFLQNILPAIDNIQVSMTAGKDGRDALLEGKYSPTLDLVKLLDNAKLSNQKA